jgi:hypothetical protein
LRCQIVPSDVSQVPGDEWLYNDPHEWMCATYMTCNPRDLVGFMLAFSILMGPEAELALPEDAVAVAAETATALTEREIGSTMDDILQNATVKKFSTSSIYDKAGGLTQADTDFDLLTRGVTVVDRGGGLRTATLSNGTKVTVRPYSSEKLPTLEVVTPGNPVLKIRY